MPLDLGRIPARLADGSLNLILGTLLKNGVDLALVFFLAALGAARAFRLRPSSTVWLPLLTSLLYFAGMATVYLATSQELSWHLSTTGKRIMLPALLCIGAAAAVLVNAIETSDSAHGIPRQAPAEREERPR